jgi:hypothetical protein
VRFTPEFLDMTASLSRDGTPWRNPSLLGRWKPDPAYSGRASFEDCGLDVIVHAECKMTKKRTHKIEILRAGEKTYDEMVALSQRIVICDPRDMGLMRTDLTADVPGVPVDWFKRHVNVKHKQTMRELGNVDAYQCVTKGRAETLYAGVKPNQVRIYDKTGERLARYQKHLRQIARMNREQPDLRMEATPFEVLYGAPADQMITRVERQVHGEHLAKLGLVRFTDLLTADLLDPFDKLVFYNETPHQERLMRNLSPQMRLAAEAIMYRVKTLGLTSTLNFMRTLYGDKSNFHRAKKDFDAFLRVADNVVGIDAKRLREVYQASTLRQLRRAA